MHSLRRLLAQLLAVIAGIVLAILFAISTDPTSKCPAAKGLRGVADSIQDFWGRQQPDPTGGEEGGDPNRLGPGDASRAYGGGRPVRRPPARVSTLAAVGAPPALFEVESNRPERKAWAGPAPLPLPSAKPQLVRKTVLSASALSDVPSSDARRPLAVPLTDSPESATERAKPLALGTPIPASVGPAAPAAESNSRGRLTVPAVAEWTEPEPSNDSFPSAEVRQ